MFAPLKKYTDEALMVLISEHQSHAALTELHRRYAKKLLGYFCKMLNGDEATAQDMVQDMFLKILEKNYLFDPNKRFYTWIFTIASNACKTAFRHQGKVIALDTKHHQMWSTNAQNLADEKAFVEAFNGCLEQLDHDKRTVVVLRFIQQFSLQEIAEITEVSLGTVKSRLFYATKEITQQLRHFDPRMQDELFKMN